MKFFVFALFCISFAGVSLAAPGVPVSSRNGFSNMNVTTEYSELLKEKNARNDSLLPALDGDKAFAEVLRLNPNFWSLGGALDKEASLVTKLNAKVVFIDGIREEPYCEIIKNSGNSAGEWNVRIGVDFVSGGSNTVHIHVQQCLDYVRDQLGYAVKKGDKVVFVPPKKVLDKIKESEIPDAIDVDLQQTLLKALMLAMPAALLSPNIASDGMTGYTSCGIVSRTSFLPQFLVISIQQVISYNRYYFLICKNT